MLKQSLQQKLLQKLSPQQIQLMKLLQVPTASLEQRIKEELESNPALEEGLDDTYKEDDSSPEDAFGTNDDDINVNEHQDQHREDFNLDIYIDDDETPAYKLAVNNQSPDEERKEVPYSTGMSFQELLLDQLHTQDLDDREEKIAEYLIGNIDEDGYLRRDVVSITDDLAFTLGVQTTDEEVEKLLKVIQSFDPPGVGARSLKECLLLQLKRKNQRLEPVMRAIRILEECMEEVSRKHYDKIQRRLGYSELQLKEAINEVLKLNPKPGNSQSDQAKSTQHIIPDFLLSNIDGELELVLNSKNAPDLRISKTYNEMLEQYAKNKKLAIKDQKEAIQFVKQKIDSAKWFIDAIKQRQQTLLFTMHAIVEFQKEYFQEGDDTKLKPMILKDIADRVALDISTISRVANSKYIQTSFGTFLIKSFFSESLTNDEGEEVSTREVKKILEDSVENEDKRNPVTDDALAKVLKEKGYNIARRTVAKYREQLGIPVARLRKEL